MLESTGTFSGRSAGTGGAAGAGRSSAAVISFSRSCAWANAALASILAFGQTGVARMISSFTVSKIATMVGRSMMASGRPSVSGGGLGKFSTCRAMS